MGWDDIKDMWNSSYFARNLAVKRREREAFLEQRKAILDAPRIQAAKRKADREKREQKREEAEHLRRLPQRQKVAARMAAAAKKKRNK